MHTHNHLFRLTAALATVSLLLAQAMPRSALAQGVPPPPPLPGVQDQQAGDPPARVGRLARVNGTVSLHGQDDTQWSPATLNYPITSGTAVWTQPDAQAVIEVSASRIVLAPGTELDIASLTDAGFQATEPQGEAYLHLRPATPDETYAVQTPRGLVTLGGPGRYAIGAGDQQNPTSVTVIEGSARIEGPGVAMDVGANQTASITGNDTFQGAIGPAQRDGFLTAMLDSERPPPQQAVALPPVVAAMPGGDELAQYGNWSDTPEYGPVWYPQVAPDWAPYSDGSWAYVAPWGWTWVDSAPWGFAPFHYGRWAEFGGRWGWVPGRGRAPVYAPALVTFLGVGAVAGVGIGAALAARRVGWLPLGPREPFHPWYRASDRYFREVNRPHITNITTVNRNVTFNEFANRRAATVVPMGTMIASRPVRASSERVDPAQLGQVRPVIGQQPLRPAPTTMGVTPAVARQLNLPQSPAGFRPVSPGPTLHAAPVAAGAVVHQGLPPLASPDGVHGPSPVMPAAMPTLRAPVSPGHAGPPPIEHQQPFGGAGAVTHVPPPNIVHPAPQGASPAAPAPQFHAPQVANPAPPAPQFHAPQVANPAPPTPQFHAPQMASPAAMGQQFHNSPGAIQPVHPVAPFHPVPPAPAAVTHAIPVAPAAPQFHAPPPQTFHPAPNIPVQAFHPQPSPPPQVFHPPPAAAPPVAHVAAPPPQFHAPPAPAAHAPPPPPPQSGQHKRPGEP